MTSREILENKYDELMNNREICLRNNDIELLDSQIFKGLINLQTIDLSDNNMFCLKNQLTVLKI